MFRHYLAPLSWALLILVLCCIPGNDLPEVRIIAFDKMVHAVLYAVFAVLLMRAFVRQEKSNNTRNHPAIIVTLIAALYGGCIEVLQEYFIPGRNGDVIDLIADVIGAVVGVLLFKKFFHKYVPE